MKKLLSFSLLILPLLTKAADWYFIDSNNGSDTNSGASRLSPWKNLNHAQSVLGPSISNSTLRLACNSYWRQELILGDWNDVDSYGYGRRPVIDASDVVANWSKVGCHTNAYAVSNFVVTGGGPVTRISVIENGDIMIAATSLSNCETNPGSFFSTHNPAPGSTNVVFIHPGSSGDPNTNGKLYEVSARNYALFYGNFNRISQLVVRNQMHNNGSIEGRRANYISYVKAENGTKHNFFLASGMAEWCEASKQSFFGGPSPSSADMFVSHDTISGQSVVYKNCKAYGSPERPAMAAGFYGHTDGENSGYSYVLFENCEGAYLQAFGGIAIQTNGIAIHDGDKLTGATLGGWSAYGGKHIFRNCEWIPDPRIAVPGQPILFSSGTGSFVWVTGCRFGAGFAAIRVDSASEMYVMDSFISGNISTLWSATGAKIVVSNTVNTFQFPYTIGNGNTLVASGSNVFNNFIAATVSGTNYNWSQFKAAFTNLEVGSINGNLKLIGSPANGDFRFDAESSAVTNLAGSGWGPSRLPYDSRLGDLKFHIPERLATK